MSYFHIAPILLEVGSLIKPGNWGRLLRLYTNANDILYRETVLENIRQSEFPEQPSRLEAVFVLETFEEAKLYKPQYASMGLIYKVEPLSPGKFHRGDYSKVTPPKSIPLMTTMPSVARAYWKAETVEQAEVLFDCSIEVKEIIEVIV